MAYAKALPGEFIRVSTNGITEPYWEGTKQGKLLAARCANCGHFRMPPSAFCPQCLAKTIDWVELKTHGIVYSFTICTRSPFREIPDFTFIPVLVEFGEAPGIRFAGNLIDIDTKDVRIGMNVETGWTKTKDGWGVPVFRPVKG